MTSRYSRYCKGALQPKPDRRAISKSLRDLERLFGGIPKRESPLILGRKRASENSNDADIVPRSKGGAQ